ncbi:M16 family metallopeptidase [Desertivirga arenae]|uniref:M16 family metallopeptidase n=1 Tax=Desertivirga arenae TaxID=2810309 RepID=UPI001A969068|nr:M16 family metallopeptidase [Pedobacter sp. SYSU D00823]
MNLRSILSLLVIAAAGSTTFAQSIPADPSIKKGRLPNGFSYYIQKNKFPEKSVQLQLVNDVGSILEEENQRGIAHFMEHMNFNGTTHFPGNSMVTQLQKSGVRFGADLNAHTSFDETVYELPLPLKDPAMLMKGMRIMRDWANEASFDAKEVEQEKGVVLEEKRLKMGVQERMSNQYLPMLFNQSLYAERLPIGTEKVISGLTPAQLKRFHSDWYRPDLQALIVVGDIEVAQVEKMIKSLFSDLPKPGMPKNRTRYNIALTGRNQYMKVTDVEKAGAEIQVMIKHPGRKVVTQEDYLAHLKLQLFNEMLSTRIKESRYQHPNAAYNTFSASVEPFLAGLDMFSFTVSAHESKLDQAFKESWLIVEQVKRFGFSQGELDRARTQFLRSMESAVKDQEHRSASGLVQACKDNFLHQEAIPSLEWEYQFVKQALPSISLQELKELGASYIKDTNRDILVLGPAKAADLLPDETAVVAGITSLSTQPLSPPSENTVTASLISDLPVAGKVKQREEVKQLGLTKLTLSNGIKVLLKPTNFQNDEVGFYAFAPGGISAFKDEELLHANFARSVGGMGLAGFSPIDLSRILNGKIVNASPFIGERSHGIQGMAAPSDLVTALQLVYLQFTQPRPDSAQFTSMIRKTKEALSARALSPENVFADTMAFVLNNYSARVLPPRPEELDRVKIEQVMGDYKALYADASAFTFVFVGNFNTEAIIPLLEQYLGSLPALASSRKALDHNTRTPEGAITKKVLKGTENKASVRLVLSGDMVVNAENRLALEALQEVVQLRLLEELREKESEVYNPSVRTTYSKLPTGRFGMMITFGCSPANADHLIEIVQKELKKLTLEGPKAEDVEKFKASYRKSSELALKNNGFWLSYLSRQSENQENLLDVTESERLLNELSLVQLRAAAKTYLDNGNFIRFILLPEKGV